MFFFSGSRVSALPIGFISAPRPHHASLKVRAPKLKVGAWGLGLGAWGLGLGAWGLGLGA